MFRNLVTVKNETCMNYNKLSKYDFAKLCRFLYKGKAAFILAGKPLLKIHKVSLNALSG